MIRDLWTRNGEYADDAKRQLARRSLADFLAAKLEIAKHEVTREPTAHDEAREMDGRGGAYAEGSQSLCRGAPRWSRFSYAHACFCFRQKPGALSRWTRISAAPARCRRSHNQAKSPLFRRGGSMPLGTS